MLITGAFLFEMYHYHFVYQTPVCVYASASISSLSTQPTEQVSTYTLLFKGVELAYNVFGVVSKDVNECINKAVPSVIMDLISKPEQPPPLEIIITNRLLHVIHYVAGNIQRGLPYVCRIYYCIHFCMCMFYSKNVGWVYLLDVPIDVTPSVTVTVRNTGFSQLFKSIGMIFKLILSVLCQFFSLMSATGGSWMSLSFVLVSVYWYGESTYIKVKCTLFYVLLLCLCYCMSRTAFCIRVFFDGVVYVIVLQIINCGLHIGDELIQIPDHVPVMKLLPYVTLLSFIVPLCMKVVEHWNTLKQNVCVNEFRTWYRNAHKDTLKSAAEAAMFYDMAALRRAVSVLNVCEFFLLTVYYVHQFIFWIS
jgi:hypothetical protein